MRNIFAVVGILIFLVSALAVEDARTTITQEPYHNPFIPAPRIDHSHSFAPMRIDSLPPFPRFHNWPTYTAGNTYYDMQHNSVKGRNIAVDHQGGVHIAWMDGINTSWTNRRAKYNYFHFDSIGGTLYPTGWFCGTDGAQADGRDRAGYVTIAIDDQHTVPTVAYHDRTGTGPHKANAAIDGMYYIMFGDARCGFLTPSVGPNPYYFTPNCPTRDLQAIWPKIAQIDTVVFMVTTVSEDTTTCLGDTAGQRLIYYRGFIKPEFGGWSDFVFEPPVMIENDQIGITGDITAFKGSSPELNRVAMAYNRHDTVVANDPCYCPIRNYYTHIFDAAALMIRISTDMGATWSRPDTITKPGVHIYSTYPESLYLGWTWDSTVTPPETVHVYRKVYSRPIDQNITYDPNGNLHMVWGGAVLTPHAGWEYLCEGTCSTGAYCQEIIFYWNDITREIDTVVFDPIWRSAGCHGHGGIAHLGYSQEPQVTVDDAGNVFVFWEQIASEYWWATDSFYPDVSRDGSRLNSEIYCAVKAVGRTDWSDPLNISNTYTPYCTVGTCKSEIEVSVANRVDRFVHLFYIEDTDPGLSPYEEGEVTLCNVKYVRFDKNCLIEAAYEQDTLCPPGTGIEEHWVSTPNTFRLGRNYPNPFNIATSFWFDVYQPNRFAIDVVDMLGRTVKRIYSGSLENGRHRFVWEGYSDNGWVVPTGIYFLKAVDKDGNSITRKITLIK